MKKSILSTVFLLIALTIFSQSTSWTGAADSTWHNPSNWTAGVPVDTVDVVIGDANYSGIYQPAVLAAANCRALTLSNGFKIAVYTKDTIKLTGNFTNNGSIQGDSTSFAIDGVNVTLGGTGTAVYNSLHVLPGVNCTVNKNISISGNLVVDGLLSASARTISFVGSTSSVISGSGTISVGSFVQDKTNSFTRLESPVKVTGNLNLASGVVYTSKSGLLSLADNATCTSGSELSYVDGPMEKVGDDVFVFPLGNNGVWARLLISAPSVVTDGFVAQYYASSYSNTDSIALSSPVMNNVSKVEYWTCERTAGNSDVSVTLYWEDNVRSDFYDFSNLVVARWSGSYWQNEGMAGSIPLAQGNVTSFVQSSFGAFTFGSLSNSNPMPIGLTYFTAKLNSQKVVDLDWQTATETNNRNFIVQKSIDGKNYNSIGTVDGAGTSLVAHSYHFSDTEPFDGLAYYRIQQIDNDGRFTYSGVRLIEFDNDRTDIQLYPNPSNGQAVTVGLPGDSKIQRVVVYNSMGQEVFQSEVSGSDNANLKVSASQLQRGLYTLIAIGDERNYTKKFIIETK